MKIPTFLGAGRILLLGGLALGLLIPLSMTRSLVTERQSRSQEAQKEIARTWGDAQTILPPVLSVPWVEQTQDTSGKIHTTETWVRQFPEQLNADVELESSTRKRGLFTTPVYTAHSTFKGEWKLPATSPAGLEKATPQWSRAVVSFQPGEARSLVRSPELKVGGLPLELSAVAPPGAVCNHRLHARLNAPDLTAQKLSFEITLDLRGSGSFALAPAAGNTSVQMRSNWTSPSFQGAFPRDKYQSKPNGFLATWNVSSLNLDIPLLWTDNASPSAKPLNQPVSTYSGEVSSENAAQGIDVFGVALVAPVDDYDSVDRSLKYAILVVCLVFCALFLFEAYLECALHPIQYLLIGAAITLFYVLTLSLSEHLGFNAAYAVAASATTGLITGYAAAVLSGWKRATLLGTGLAVLWGFLLTLLKAEDWSLLMGSIGLFFVLALIMWLTRRIDWTRHQGSTPTPVATHA